MILAGLVTVLILVLISLGMPIAFTLLTGGCLGIVLLFDVHTVFYTLAKFPVSRLSEFVWTALPLFILIGNFAEISGVASDAYDLANKWLGHLKGGLVIVTIGACGFIAATTASGATGTAIMGKIAVPEMEKRGYDMRLATGATAASGTVGILIPPSAALLVIGILGGLSVGTLFIAAFLPGILSVLMYIGLVNIRCRLNPSLAPDVTRFAWKERIHSLIKGWGVVLIFGSIMGGLYTGIATPTEVAAVGSGVAMLMALLGVARRRCTWKQIRHAFFETCELSAMIFAFIIGASVFSLFLTMSGVVPTVVEIISNLDVPRIVIFLIILSIYIPLGMFLDSLVMILLTVPIFFPVILGLGFDGIWFSILIVKMAELGGITPPVGMGLFVMKGVYPSASLEDIMRGALWFMMADLVTITILIIFPIISTWLPSLMK